MRFLMKRARERSVRGRGHGMSMIKSLERIANKNAGKAPRGRDRWRSMEGEISSPKEERTLSGEQIPMIEKVTRDEKVTALDLVIGESRRERGQ